MQTRIDDDPVTIWLHRLQEIDEVAAAKLWHHYCSRLRALARMRLPANVRRVYDEDDAAVSAFQSLCQGMQEGRFADLSDRNELWKLLAVITARKVIRRQKYENRQKRGGRNSDQRLFSDTSSINGIDQVPSREPTPEFAAEAAETYDALFSKMPDDSLRAVAARRMEGFTNQEIADQLDIGLRSVERKLNLIRRLWETDSEEPEK